MSLPFPATIAYERVKANIRHLVGNGMSTGAAAVEAFSAARKSYFRQHPQGVLPKWLRLKASMHSAAFYDSEGKPLKSNPAMRPAQAREISAAKRLYAEFTGHEADESVKVNIPGVRFKVGFIVGHVFGLELNIGDAKFAPNDAGGLPALTVSHDGREVAFVGGDYVSLIDYLESKNLDNPVIEAIMYRTVRDGKVENYRHAFAPYARPALQVLDERNAKMSGGSFRFTDRGFVDSRSR